MALKRIVLVYTGYEQGTWGDISFRREQYYHFLPGILYLAAALRKARQAGMDIEVLTRHYNTTVQSPARITADLVSLAPDCIGFACYCWNIDLHTRFARDTKDSLPGVKVVFGGPEITMKTTAACRAFFAACPYVDLLVFGEAEGRIAALATALLARDFSVLKGLDGYSFHPRYGEHSVPATAHVPALSEVPVIYPHPIEVERSPGAGVFVVYEASRGCPNKCIYCTFAHWRSKQHAYPAGRVERELKWLLEQEVDGIHFADAVFDQDPAAAARLLELLIEHNRQSTFLCYCSFNTLNAELVGLFEKSQMQCGVGVQSTNAEVLRTIRRFMPAKLFSKAPALLAGHRVNFYMDLMFGLPRDSLESFRTSFDDAMRLHPAFLMPFPLTLIRGTLLGDNPESYGVVRYSDEDLGQLDLQCNIEYLNIGLANGFSVKDLEVFDDVAVSCFFFYNRFPNSLRYLEMRGEGSAFDLYRRVGQETKRFLHRTAQRATNTAVIEGLQDEIERVFIDVLRRRGAGQREQAAFAEIFKLDLFRLVVLRSPHREKIHRQTLSLGPSHEIPEHLGADTRLVKTTFGKTIVLGHQLPDLRNLHALRERIEPARCSVFVHAPFAHADATIRQVSDRESFILDLLATGRGLRVKAILSSLNKRFDTDEDGGEVTEMHLRTLCEPLVSSGAVGIV